MASGILSSQRAIGSTAGFAIMGSILAATISVVLPGNLESSIPDPAQRDQVVTRVVDDANPHAVAALIGPGKPLPQNVAEDDAVLNAADDAFITGIRVAMLLGFSSRSAHLPSVGGCFRAEARPRSKKSRSSQADWGSP